MFKTLIATCLLTFSCTGMSPTRTTPLKAVQRVGGIYNFKNEYTLDMFLEIEDYFIDTYDTTVFDEVVVLEETSGGRNFVNPCYIHLHPYEMCYITSIDLRGDFEYGFIDMYINYYDSNENIHYYQEIIRYNENNSIEDLTFYDMYFMVRSDSVIIRDEALDLFNFLFTLEDNVYVESVDGFYTLYNTTTKVNALDCLGNIIVGTNLYYGFYCSNATNNTSINWLRFNAYTNAYQTDSNILSAWPRQWFFNNCKMTHNSKLLMSTTYGVFDYVEDTQYNDASFDDLFFSVVDTPIYALSQLLSFEIFGVNLFNALASIITLMLVVVVVRKLL